jgi:hypothetical protein
MNKQQQQLSLHLLVGESNHVKSSSSCHLEAKSHSSKKKTASEYQLPAYTEVEQQQQRMSSSSSAMSSSALSPYQSLSST